MRAASRQDRMNPRVPTRPSRAGFREFDVTLLFLVAYVALFHLWGRLDKSWVVASGILASALLGAVIVFLGRRSTYFLNGWDQLFHGFVVLDLLLEAIFVGTPEHLGFYGCAVGFGLVIGGYRFALLRRVRVQSVS